MGRQKLISYINLNPLSCVNIVERLTWHESHIGNFDGFLCLNGNKNGTEVAKYMLSSAHVSIHLNGILYQRPDFCGSR